MELVGIYNDIWRIEVCAWAFGWSDDRLRKEIMDMIIDKQFEYILKREEETRQITEDFIFYLNKKSSRETYLLDDSLDKNRSYGNKYIKRKFR